MLEAVKQALRIKSGTFDAELTSIIEAAKLDLSISGVAVIKDTDPLIRRAIIIYCQANFGNSAEADRYQKSYEMLKNHLALCGDYNGKGIKEASNV